MPTRYSSSDLIKLLTKDGWYEVSCNGSHHRFEHKMKKGCIIVPHPKKRNARRNPKNSETEIILTTKEIRTQTSKRKETI